MPTGGPSVACTAGFDGPVKLNDHFLRHGALVGAATEAEYQSMADHFLGAPKPTDELECTRKSDGDLLRFRVSTQEFGILRSDGVIRTYHIRVSQSGPLNHRWFNSRCKK